MNTTLKTKVECDNFNMILRKTGLHPHPDYPKNWDSLSTLSYILKNSEFDDVILDSGGEVYSPLVDHLLLYGYKSLYVINKSFDSDFNRGRIKYIKGDCTNTDFPSSSFDIITCLSVIEHGIDIDDFLEECYRLLTVGGILIISTDYWDEYINTLNKTAYGANIKIFNRNEINEIMNKATKVGFESTGEIDFSTVEKVVSWDKYKIEYTFILFALKKIK